MRYKVLWIDDEYIKQKDFIGEAEQEEIDIDAVESHEEGMVMLLLNPDLYHAVILDAKVKNGKDDTHTGLAGLTSSRDRLNEINKNRYLPYFIFTGQPDYADKDWFNQAYCKYYIKAIDNDNLFKDLKIAIEKKEEYQIQKKYQHVFDVCVEKYVGDISSKYLMDILVNIDFRAEKFEDEKYFNGLRKVIELVFRASNKLGVLHDKCIQSGKVNLTWSRLFMSGKEVELKTSNEKIWSSKIYLPILLANNVKCILDSTNAASHTEEAEKENGKANFSEYKKQIKSNYLLYSLAFQVMDLVLWFKNYADENPDKEKNKCYWMHSEEISNDWQEGTVINLNISKGFAFFKPNIGLPNTIIPPLIVLGNHIANNDKVSVIIEQYEDIVTKQIKTRVKQLKKVK